MALYDELVHDCQKGLVDFDGWVVTEGSDFRLSSPGYYILSNGLPFNWTLLTNTAARIYDPETEVTIIALTWEPHVDGSFALTASDSATTALAGDYGENCERRAVKVTAYGDLPDGRRLQLVDATKIMYIAQKGPIA